LALFTNHGSSLLHGETETDFVRLTIGDQSVKIFFPQQVALEIRVTLIAFKKVKKLVDLQKSRK
jgi:hypothetical protein